MAMVTGILQLHLLKLTNPFKVIHTYITLHIFRKNNFSDNDNLHRSRKVKNIGGGGGGGGGGKV